MLLTPVAEPIVARKQREKHARLYSFIGSTAIGTFRKRLRRVVSTASP